MGGMSPKNDTFEQRYRKNLTLKDVELEHLKTTIIALNEDYKVVEDLHKDTKNIREKEQHHQSTSYELDIYIKSVARIQQLDCEEKNAKFEDMLDTDNKALENEIQEVMRQIARVNQERED